MQSKVNNEKFQFGDNVHTLLVLFEDRKGECMDELAIENAFFLRRRFQHTEEMKLLPILKRMIKFSKFN